MHLRRNLWNGSTALAFRQACTGCLSRLRRAGLRVSCRCSISIRLDSRVRLRHSARIKHASSGRAVDCN